MTKSTFNDFVVLSKFKQTPFAETIQGKDWLFYKGEYWDINLLLQDFYTFDSDVYSRLELDPTLHGIFMELSEAKKVSVYYNESKNTWCCKSDQTSLQDEFLTWLTDDLNFNASGAIVEE